MADIAAGLILVVVAVLPIILILRWNLVGFIIGAFVVWFGPVLTGFVPGVVESAPGDSLLLSAWMMFGGFGGLLYCALIFGLKWAFVAARSRRRPEP